MSIAIDAFKSTLGEAVRSEPWRDGELLVTPWGFSDHEPIVLYVRAVDGTYVVSDRGQASDNLSLAGVDLRRPAVAKSWEAVKRSVDMYPFVQDRSSQWELCATANADDDLGLAIHQVAGAAMRADGLRALGQVKAVGARFDAWVIREASDKGLTVLPHAEIRSTAGVTRKVSALIEGSKKAYVQALGPAKDPWEAYDRARSVFSDTSLDPSERYTVIAHNSRLSAEQIRGIGQHSEVVDEKDFGSLLQAVA